jgi:hypothetical protein
VLAVDVVIFAVTQAELQVLLHRRNEDPFQGAWTLPGVAMRMDETLETHPGGLYRKKPCGLTTLTSTCILNSWPRLMPCIAIRADERSVWLIWD